MGADDNDNEKEGVGGRWSGEGCGDDRIMSVAGCVGDGWCGYLFIATPCSHLARCHRNPPRRRDHIRVPTFNMLCVRRGGY